MMRSTVEEQIYSWYYNATDPRMDGFYQFSYKQKLYAIKWLVDELLPKCPVFVGEEEFVEENRSKYESKQEQV